MACSLTELGHKVVVFAPKGSKVPPKGFLVECCEPELKVQTDWLSAERKMWEHYKGYLGDFDIIHSHTWFGFAFASKVKSPQLRVCQTMHGGANPEWWCRSKPPFKLNFIAISKWMQQVYAQQGIPSRVCHNGINLEKYPFSENHGNRFLFLSRISRIKAPHVAIQVAKQAGIELDVAGATNFVDDPSYVEQIKNACDGKRIRFLGEVSHEEKLKLLQNARALIVSGKWGEPFGLHVVESLAVGSPVIALKDGGILETMEDGKTGFLCENEAEMVSAVSRLNAINRRDCRERVEKHFSRTIMAENYLKRYSEILSGDLW